MATGPEYMNATPHHSKIRVSLALSSSLFIAGQDVTGKMEMECRADKDVGLGLIMVELFAIQELNSRDHSASSTFLHSRRLFQGPGLPPSNAVEPYPIPGESFPQGHFPARRGITTFFFRFHLPLSSPSTISFASGLAKIRYEVRASVGVAHRGEKRVVTNVTEADVVQCEDMDGIAAEHVVVGENGKMYVQGQILGGRIISGQQACLELRVRNHSPRKTTGLSLTLTRVLHLNSSATTSQAPVQLSDTLCSQNFRGAEYCVQAGTEGVANLVFDVPKVARVVKGGIREGTDDDEGGRRRTEPLFEIQCMLSVKVGMGIGHKDVMFEMGIQLSHPATLPEDTPILEAYTPPMADLSAVAPDALHPSPGSMSPVFHLPNPYLPHSPGPEAGTSSPPYPYTSPPIPSLSASPPQQYFHPSSPYAHSSQHQRLWSPPLPAMSPLPYYAPGPFQAYYFPPPPVPLVPFAYPARPSSAGAIHSHNISPASGGQPSGLPGVETVGPVYPSYPQHPQHPDASFYSHLHPQPPKDDSLQSAEGEEGKGERASRISNHLRMSTRARSMSPTSHRFPAPPSALPVTTLTLDTTNPQGHGGPPLLSPRPMLSPRSSFNSLRDSSQDIHGTSKSGRVDLLERMVDPAPGEEGKSVKDVLDDLEKVEKEMETRMPSSTASAPSGKPEALRKVSGVPKASEVFGFQSVDQKNGKTEERPVKSVLRPSPMARRISINDKDRQVIRGQGRKGSRDGALRLKPEQHSNGLDALERRLLLEVGTRKPGAPERPTVFELGLNAKPTIPRSTNASTSAQAGDSEISSLALASNGSTDLPPYTASHAAGATVTPASDNIPAISYVDSMERIGTKDSERNAANEDRSPVTRKERPSEERAKEQEVIKLRKAAKGRVANWLGGVATGPSPDEEMVTVHDARPLRRLSGPEHTSEGPLMGKRLETHPVTSLSSPTPIPKLEHSSPSVKASRTLSVPNLSTGSTSPSPGLTSPLTLDKSDALRGRPLSKPVVETSALSHTPSTLRKTPSPASRRKPVPPLDETALEAEISKPSPAQSVPPLDETVVNGRVSMPTPAPELERVARQLTKSPLLQSIPETKYDVRSARGGRGGITTSVAALWASLAQEGEKSNQPIRPPKPASTRPTSLDVGRSKASPTLKSTPHSTRHDAATLPASTTQPAQPRNMVKSASVPATVVPSHAKPYLSSTASLARPPTVPLSRTKPPTLSSTLSECTPEDSTNKVPPVSPRDTAFGQARLKELIKKYQQSTS